MSTFVTLRILNLWAVLLLYPWLQPASSERPEGNGPLASTSSRISSFDHMNRPMKRLSQIARQLFDCTSQRALPRARKFALEHLEARNLMAVTVDADGWTVVTPSNDSRVIYVSSSAGNDANNGLSPDAPKATAAAGKALLRSGYPDHLLFKRGDTWTDESIGSVPGGRNAQEPTLIGAYGTGDRPKFLTPANTNLISKVASGSFVAIIGLHATPNDRKADESPAGIRWNAVGSDIIIEDNCLDGYATNLIVQGPSGKVLEDVQIRRNVITNSWSTTSHSQGMYSTRLVGVLIEENYFDHNGWNDDLEGAEATIYNHHIYISEGGVDNRTTGVTIRGNVFSRASNHAVKMEATEGEVIVENNLMVANGVGGQWGMGSGATGDGVNGLNLKMWNNVWTEGAAVANNNNLGPEIQNVASGFFRNNILANRDPADGSGGSWQFLVNDHVDGVGINNFDIEDNIFYNLRGPFKLLDPVPGGAEATTTTISGNSFSGNMVVLPNGETDAAPLVETDWADSGEMVYSGNTYYSPNDSDDEWFEVEGSAISASMWKGTYEADAKFENPNLVDPTRTTVSYAATLGLTNFEQLVDQWKQQSRQNWIPAVHAAAINDYIREGFELDPVGVTPLPSPSAPTQSSVVPTPSFSPSTTSVASSYSPSSTWSDASQWAEPQVLSQPAEYNTSTASSDELQYVQQQTQTQQKQTQQRDAADTVDDYSLLVDEALADELLAW